MKTGLILVAALLLMLPLQAEIEPAGMAAKVNGDYITKAELEHQVDAWFTDSDLPAAQLQAAREERREQALRALIERRLILQAFAREGEKIPDGVIGLRLDSIVAEEFAGDRNAFLSTRRERGITLEKYRQEIADNWIVGHMRRKHPSPGWPLSLTATAAITIY